MTRRTSAGEGGFEAARQPARSDTQHIARIAGLREFRTPTLEAVERRRVQLLVFVVTGLGALVSFFSLLTFWWNVPLPGWLQARVLEGGILVFVALTAAYALEKEGQLQRLSLLLVEEKVLAAALTSRVHELEQLLLAGRAVNQFLDLGEVLKRILEAARELLNADSGSMMLLHGADELRTVSVAGRSRAHDARVAVGEGVAGRAAASREPLLITGSLPSGGGQQSAMSVPLIHRGRLLGVVNVNAPQGRAYTEHDLRALALFGEQAAGAIANAQLYEAQRLLASQKQYLALHDTLTNLPNRGLFLQRLEHVLQLTRTGRPALLYLDLDNFKTLNDTFGHAAGDRALGAVAERLLACCGSGQTVARLGGDEFAVLVEDAGSPTEVRSLAERVRAAIGAPLQLGEGAVELRASIGIALSQGETGSPESMMQEADSAMYAAKDAGGDCAVVFRQKAGELPPGARSLEDELAAALAGGRLEVYFQPVVSLRDDTIRGIEALLRWRHPTRGLQRAAQFMAAVPAGEVLKQVDRWVLGQGWSFLLHLREHGLDGEQCSLHVNLPAPSLRAGEVADWLFTQLDELAVDPNRLVVEVPERALQGACEVGLAQLRKLRSRGIRVALDDFGSGQMPASILQGLPVDIVKIDAVFVAALRSDTGAAGLVEAVLRLGTSLGIDVIAEGIERREQLDHLLALGCRSGQGTLLCEPLPASRIEGLLAERVRA